MDHNQMVDRLIGIRDYWYLASPYSKHPRGITAAFEEAAEQAALLLNAGVRVFSPIAHSHPISVHGSIDPANHDLWLAADAPLLHAACGVIVARMDGWDTSFGVGVELELCRRAGKPIVFMEPGVVPSEFTDGRV